jgi:hypothetical protein
MALNRPDPSGPGHSVLLKGGSGRAVRLGGPGVGDEEQGGQQRGAGGYEQVHEAVCHTWTSFVCGGGRTANHVIMLLTPVRMLAAGVDASHLCTISFTLCTPLEPLQPLCCSVAGSHGLGQTQAPALRLCVKACMPGFATPPDRAGGLTHRAGLAPASSL